MEDAVIAKIGEEEYVIPARWFAACVELYQLSGASHEDACLEAAGFWADTHPPVMVAS